MLDWMAGFIILAIGVSMFAYGFAVHLYLGAALWIIGLSVAFYGWHLFTNKPKPNKPH